jgi:hypothetical protein
MNKRRVSRALTLIPALFMLALCAAPAFSSMAATETCANPIFGPVLASLQAGTNVPLRLPSVVGGEYDATLYADVSWIGSTRYVVRIGQHCERSYCPYGAVSGMKITEQASRPRGKVVELAGGVKGYLTDGSKALNNSTITWDEGQYRYSIAIYAAEPEALIKVVNSALSCDNR